MLLARHAVVADGEDDARVARLAEADRVAGLQLALGDLLAVDERAELRLAVAQQDPAVLHEQLGVLAGDVGAGDADVALAAPAEGQHRPLDGNRAAAERVGDDQTRSDVGGHGWRII